MSHNREPRRGPILWIIGLVLFSCSPVAQASGDAIQRYKLDNGLSVILCPADDTQQIALITLYSIGDDSDPPNKSGLSHLTEHIYVTAAAGNNPSRNVQQYVAQYPAGWNAQTGSDYTVFATVFNASLLENELADAAARMAELRPTEELLDREKGRLLDEVANMFGNIPQLAALNHARQNLRPAQVAYRKGGHPEQVKPLTLGEVKAWWRNYYKPNNATLVLTGGFKMDRARNSIAKHFAIIAKGKTPPKPRSFTQPDLGKASHISTPTKEGYACIAFAAPLPGDEHYPATILLVSRMMNQGSLFSKRPDVFFAVLDDPTTIAISSPIKPKETPEEAAGRLRSFLDKSLQTPLSSSDKLAVKNSLGVFLGITEMPRMMFKQNLYGVAFSLGRRAQLGLDSGKLSGDIESLTDDQVKAAAAEVFAPKLQSTAIVSPQK